MEKKSGISEVASWVLTILVAIILALIIRTFIFEVVQVKQSSMKPTLIENEKLLSVKIGYKFSSPEIGDIVIVKISDKTDYVKRVIALEGETIEIKDSKVYIDGELLNEDYLPEGITYEDFPSFTVSEGHYFLMGDNRAYSRDSRDPSIGEIKAENIIGHAVFRIYPFDRFGKIK